MAPLPGALGGRDLVAWRLDRAVHAATWDAGQAAYLYGGRWNTAGVRAVYCALDPGAMILEVAVHAGLRFLDTVAHVVSEARIDVADVHMVQPDHVPNPNWLRPGAVSANQQAFGNGLLAEHRFVVMPSATSPGSWNLIFAPETAAGYYELRSQERFGLDPRFQPPDKMPRP